MPYNPGGIFSLVASYFANPGTTIRTEQHNPVFEDVGAALSQVVLRDGRAPMTGQLNMNGFPINNVATGNTPSSVATLAQAMPIGAVIDYGGTTAPSGWLLCYGQAVSRSTYAALYAIVGEAYGAGDGSTTFNVPDLRGRVVAGRDNLGGTSASRLSFSFGTNNIRQGAASSLDYEYLTTPMLPIVAPTFSGTNVLLQLDADRADFVVNPSGAPPSASISGGAGGRVLGSDATIARPRVSASYTPGGTISQFGEGKPHSTIQPTLLMSKIIKASYDG